MGAIERLQAVIKDLTEAELARLASIAETIAKKHQSADQRVQAALRLFAQHRGAYRGGFDREAAPGA